MRGKVFCMILLATMFAGSINVKAQGVLDGIYVKEHIPTKKVISYTYLREADVMWEKRVWRIVDLREKINQPLFYPLLPLSDRWSLWDIIKYKIEFEPGSLTLYEVAPITDVYATDGDQFKYPVKYGGPADSAYKQMCKDYLMIAQPEATEPLVESVTADGVAIYKTLKNPDGTDQLDSLGNPKYQYPPRIYDPILADKVVEWEIKEDWFFDKQRSVMDVRIVGISPRMYEVNAAGKIIGIKNKFWIYFPELRYIIQNYFVYNRKNDAQRMSFDDLFWKRMFNSYIRKESNVFDRMIPDYVTGVDALLESERIKKEMTEIEHDMWDL